MKTTKVMLVAAIMAIATLGFAQTEKKSSPFSNDLPEPTLSMTIHLTSAVHNPGLAKAIRAQVGPTLLRSEQRIYTVPVSYGRVTYQVWGTYSEWSNFFSVKPTKPNEC